MNEDILKGKWSELKGEAKKKWGKLTDDDLMVISGQKEKLVGVLQTKYGYAKEKAEEEYKSFLDSQK
ncbi:MAG: CsbD family protein [Bacillota bacterium]|nr:CsbD family protein [Bacillota bacterium]